MLIWIPMEVWTIIKWVFIGIFMLVVIHEIHDASDPYEKILKYLGLAAMCGIIWAGMQYFGIKPLLQRADNVDEWRIVKVEKDKPKIKWRKVDEAPPKDRIGWSVKRLTKAEEMCRAKCENDPLGIRENESRPKPQRPPSLKDDPLNFFTNEG